MDCCFIESALVFRTALPQVGNECPSWVDTTDDCQLRTMRVRKSWFDSMLKNDNSAGLIFGSSALCGAAGMATRSPAPMGVYPSFHQTLLDTRSA